MRQDFRSVNSPDGQPTSVPLVTDPWTVAALVGRNKDHIYVLVREKNLRTLPGHGHIKILMSSIESYFGIRVTPEIYLAAHREASAKRANYLDYQNRYRAQQSPAAGAPLNETETINGRAS